jgi:hypothetical protein
VSNDTLRQALTCADRGWPVFPCQPGMKTPAPGTASATPRPTSNKSLRGSAAVPTGTWPSPPALLDLMSSTSTSTAMPGMGSPPWRGFTPPGC